MIRNFNDHAANERTFLAWVRTAVAIVGIGILLGKLGAPSGATTLSLASALLLIFGMLMILGAGVRFLMLRKLIEQDRETEEIPVLLDIVLAVVMLVLFATLASFGTHLFETL